MNEDPGPGRMRVIIPVISAHTADICIPSILMDKSASGIHPEDILIVDNSRDGFAGKYGLRTYRDPDGHNLGVARSWNVGAREVLDNPDLDYLVIMSSTMHFGPILHTAWTWQMETFWGENVLEADGHSAHLIAFHRRVFERIGLFDENFYPGYFEMLDWSYRMRMVGWEGGWRRLWVNALSQGYAMHNEMVNCPADPLLRYIEGKWGGPKGAEKYEWPWGNQPLDYWPEAAIPELAERYGLGEKGVGWW